MIKKQITSICDLCQKEEIFNIDVNIIDFSQFILDKYVRINIKGYDEICKDCYNNLINMLEHVKQVKDWRKYKHDYEFKDWQ